MVLFSATTSQVYIVVPAFILRQEGNGMKGDEVMGNEMHLCLVKFRKGKPDRPDSRAPRVHPTPHSFRLHTYVPLLNTQGIYISLYLFSMAVILSDMYSHLRYMTVKIN